MNYRVHHNNRPLNVAKNLVDRIKKMADIAAIIVGGSVTRGLADE